MTVNRSREGMLIPRGMPHGKTLGHGRTMNESNGKPGRTSARKWLIFGLATLVVIFVAAASWNLRRAYYRNAAIAAIEKAGGWIDTRPAFDKPYWLSVIAEEFLPGRIDTIGFDRVGITHEMAKHLAWLSETKTLYLGDVTLSESSLSFAESMDELQTLLIRHAALPDSELADLPANLKELWLDGVEIGDEGLTHIFRYRNLLELAVGGRQITDRGTAGISGLSQLQSLSIGETNITDVTMSRLAHLHHLKSLSLSGCLITDAGLMHLEMLNRLEILYLDGTNVTGAGMKHLASLKRLETLALDRTRVNDDGIAQLEAMKHLHTLDLNQTAVTDAGLKHLVALESLFFLSLAATQVTDEGIQVLRALPKLERLDVTDTQVTNAGVSKLRAHLPELEVWN